MKTIALVTKGKVALVDDDLYEKLAAYRWYLIGKGYAARSIKNEEGKWVFIRMHHEVTGKPENGFQIDHIDGNTFNNTRANLRLCTHIQNSWNRGSQAPDVSSLYKGVSWHKHFSRLFEAVPNTLRHECPLR